MISILTPSGSKNLILRGIMTAGGLKRIAEAHITTPTGSKQFWDSADYSELTVNLVSYYVVGGAASFATVDITSEPAYASAVGASEPVTWLWTPVSVDAPGWSILTPNASSSAFRVEDVVPEQTREATFKVTATDANGATGEAEVFVQCTNYGGF